MQVTTTPSGFGATVLLSGELDLNDAERLEILLELACEDRRVVVVDLADVSFIDSTILDVFVAAAPHASGSDCHLHLVNSRSVARVLDAVGLN